MSSDLDAFTDKEPEEFVDSYDQKWEGRHGVWRRLDRNDLSISRIIAPLQEPGTRLVTYICQVDGRVLANSHRTVQLAANAVSGYVRYKEKS